MLGNCGNTFESRAKQTRKKITQDVTNIVENFNLILDDNVIDKMSLMRLGLTALRNRSMPALQQVVVRRIDMFIF